MPTFHPAAALCSGVVLMCLAGCQTEGGFGATMGDFRNAINDAIGLDPAVQDTKSQVKEPLQEIATHQRDVRDQVQQTYDELDALTRAPDDELDTQHAAYTQALREVREQADLTTKLRGEAHAAADTYAAEVTRTLTQKVSNPTLNEVAQRNLDLFKTGVTDTVSQTGRYDVDLNPVLAKFDGQAAILKDGATTETVGQVRGELAKLKSEVEAVLAQLDQQAVELDKLVDQVDVVDGSMTALGI